MALFGLIHAGLSFTASIGEIGQRIADIAHRAAVIIQSSFILSTTVIPIIPGNA
jgi:hypothetical protein